MRFFNGLKIATVGWGFVITLVLSGSVLLGSAWWISNDVLEVRVAWNTFQIERSEKSNAAGALRSNLGYGGMIHQFKNYVLRQDQPRIRKVQTKLGAALAQIERYRTLGANPAEARALDDIAGVIGKYSDGLATAQAMAEAGATAEDIDGAVKISDGPALQGLATLDAEIEKSHMAQNGNATEEGASAETSRGELLVRLANSMGYGGMIHQFKNYVLRQDQPRIAKVQAAIREAKEVVDLYASLDTTTTESRALNDIRGVIGAYAEGLNQAVRLAGQGKTAAQIDATVKVNDGPALNGLATLNREIVARSDVKAAEVDEILVEVTNLATVSMYSTLGVITFLIFASLWVIRGRVVGPISKIVGVMTRLAEGDNEVEVFGIERGDEIGDMAKTLQVFKDNAIEKVRLESEQEANRKRALEEKRQSMNELADRFEAQVKEVVDSVSSAATEMQSTAQQMSATAEETSRQSANVASASEQATANVQTVAATAEELSASIAEIGRQVSQSAKVAGNAVEEANSTNQTVQGLAESAAKIGEVVDLINDIAGQTNLLALNATIEAARAGEAGKGFAVVAQEVKNLANQTAKATEEISTQITAVQEETTGAVGAIEKIGSIIGEVNDIATTIASAVEEQGLSTQEIARNVQQAAKGTQDVNTNIESVSKAASETGSAANQVLGAAQEMSRQAEGLRGEVEKFLAEVRVA